jgi:tRNA-splicing ligase RtcB
VVQRQDLTVVGTHVWEVAKSYRPDMRVAARLIADETLLEQALTDRSLQQLVNSATLPGAVSPVLAMPDIHQGYGLPIGGVVATRCADGVVSPGGVGYDICCGVRLLASSIHALELSSHLDVLATALQHFIPAGVGGKGNVRVSPHELDRLIEQGSRWAVRQGYGYPEDLEHTEDRGCMASADAAAVSRRAKERGKSQVGTLGGGNHFVEIDEVIEVYDDSAGAAFGLWPGQIVCQIHSGSRGFGHQVCTGTDYVRLLQEAVVKHGISLPDRQLVCAPVQSPEGQRYLAAMACAANYAWNNRQVLAHGVRRAFEAALAGHTRSWNLRQVYDVAHNVAKIESHLIEGRRQKLCVHRKGATRAYGPGRREVPEAYRRIGQPVLVPGSMGTASYVLAGTEEAMRITFGSCAHGAGRTMSRGEAKRRVQAHRLRSQMEEKGIHLRAGSMRGVAEEAPEAYKDVDRVVEVVHRAGIGRKVARLAPLIVVKA